MTSTVSRQDRGRDHDTRFLNGSSGPPAARRPDQLDFVGFRNSKHAFQIDSRVLAVALLDVDRHPVEGQVFGQVVDKVQHIEGADRVERAAVESVCGVPQDEAQVASGWFGFHDPHHLG